MFHRLPGTRWRRGAPYTLRPNTRSAQSRRGLRQEVKPYNIRTTIISPGAVATELHNTITDPDVAERIRKVYAIAIPADSFANIVVFAMSQPEDMDVNEILFRPTRQEY